MPGARVHGPVGTIAGLVYALHEAPESTALHTIAEGFGGALGGHTGGLLPDCLDPPTSPHHRAHAHGLALAAALIVARPRLRHVIGWIREQAREWEERSEVFEHGSLDWLTCQFIALLLRALAGFVNGLYAGYLSHLGLDVWTPASLPLV